jgi:zinc protease
MNASGVLHRTTACLAVALFVASTSASASPARPAFSLPVFHYRLANGLNVVLAPDAALSETSVVIRYEAGSADDPPGKEGLAHLVEHLMFAGSRHVGRGEYSRALARAGGSYFGGQTSLDATFYFATATEAGLPTLLWLESDRMGFFLDGLNPVTLETEKHIIADETRDTFFDRTLGQLGPAGWMQIFPTWHPYHRDLGGATPADCTLDDVRAFWATWYSPSNATIAIAGRFDPDAVRALIAEDFGDLPSIAPPARPTLDDAWRVHDVLVEAAANVPHDVVTLYWKAPALDDPGDRELDLAALILADPGGRLQRALVTSGHALSVSARESSWRRRSWFWISAVVAEGSTAEDVVAGIDGAVRELGTSARPDEYERARDEWFDRLMLGLETSEGRAIRISRPSSTVPWDLTRYDGIGPDQIAAAVHANLKNDNRVVVIVHHDPRYGGGGIVLTRKSRLP